MRALKPVDGEGNLADPARDCALDALIGHLSRAADNAAEHPAPSNLGGDQVPVLAQIELAADQRHLLDAEIGELMDQLERLCGGQLIVARAARARAAMTTAQIAAKRDLPDRDAWRALVRLPAGELLRIAVVTRVDDVCDRLRVQGRGRGMPGGGPYTGAGGAGDGGGVGLGDGTSGTPVRGPGGGP